MAGQYASQVRCEGALARWTAAPATNSQSQVPQTCDCDSVRGAGRSPRVSRLAAKGGGELTATADVTEISQAPLAAHHPGASRGGWVLDLSPGNGAIPRLPVTRPLAAGRCRAARGHRPASHDRQRRELGSSPRRLAPPESPMLPSLPIAQRGAPRPPMTWSTRPASVVGRSRCERGAHGPRCTWFPRSASHDRQRREVGSSPQRPTSPGSRLARALRCVLTHLWQGNTRRRCAARAAPTARPRT